jgi:cytochrome c
MKNLFFIGILFLVAACKNNEADPYGKKDQTGINKGNQTTLQTSVELGAALFSGKGNCVACHQVAQNGVGPSIQQMASVYKAKNGDIIAFLVKDAAPLIDPSQYAIMQTNFVITKAMSDEELKGLEAYIYSKLQ